MKHWIISGLLAFVLGIPVVSAQESVLVLEGGMLIDGTGSPPVPDAVVVIRGERIEAVGSSGDVAIPPEATVIPLQGQTILPGFIDTHLHLRDYQVPMFLPYGITTLADIHNNTAWSLEQRDALASGRIKGPRLFVSGARLTGPDSAPANEGRVETVAEARAYVRNLVQQGVDQIKVDLTITDEQLRAVLEEADDLGVRVLGHTQDIREAVAMGMRHMEHMDTMARSLLKQEGRNPRPSDTTSEAAVNPDLFGPLIEYLVARDVYVNPTLVLSWSGSTERWHDWTPLIHELVEDPALAFIPDEARAAWLREPRVRAGYANVVSFLYQYSQAGGKILAATDTGCCAQIVPGLSLHQEMQLLTDMGIAPMQAIQGATLWAAEVIGQQQNLGSIEPGKYADITIVDGNPLSNIEATRQVTLVIKSGQVVDTTYDPEWVNPIPRY
ncbi:MAG: amidohydrolase family protein [Gammaproteobacteria bacterium]|nr:amidohydrolase family protein [Pseudomonadales bacterium]MCP5349262.1 amidohydrolase family protein [Pseudomonadales bacterium]